MAMAMAEECSTHSKLHCGRCLPCRQSISSAHPTHGSGKNQFSGNIPNYEWASSPDGSKNPPRGRRCIPRR
ncbi:hypothetical protein AMTR_s00164p00082050 [Amborella trichopoda]|uniref:Uncharacterized protein n=1 Tax=Amborella trichopoda TaxID=13333 RepID=W1PUF4_AMBTC|nr:hypothetical protein AMTR_s00164p00082050 [Amborella trichopoda]